MTEQDKTKMTSVDINGKVAPAKETAPTAPPPPYSSLPPPQSPPQPPPQPVTEPPAGMPPDIGSPYSVSPDGLPVDRGQPPFGTTVMYMARPERIICQNCMAAVTTVQVYEVSAYTWLVFYVILQIGCCCGCCLIPFYSNNCKDVIHVCPNCNFTVGRYNRI